MTLTVSVSYHDACERWAVEDDADITAALAKAFDLDRGTRHEHIIDLYSWDRFFPEPMQWPNPEPEPPASLHIVVADSGTHAVLRWSVEAEGVDWSRTENASSHTPVITVPDHPDLSYPANAVLPIRDALDAATEYARTSERPRCVRWQSPSDSGVSWWTADLV